MERTKREILEGWKDEHPSIEKWLKFYRKSTANRYLPYAYEYFENWMQTDAPEQYKGKSPEELIEMQNNCKSKREEFEQVELLLSWINSKTDLSFATQQFKKSAIYSFYSNNHVPLPKDPRFSVKMRYKRETVNGHLTVKELRQIILSSNELYQAIFTVMFQSGMGTQELLYVNSHSWEQIKSQLDAGNNVIRIDLHGRKKDKRNYFTFFGRDGKERLLKWLEHRERLVRKSDKKDIPSLEESIFLNEKLNAPHKVDIRSYFTRHCKRLGLITEPDNASKSTRYRISLHEIRDTFRTFWNRTPLGNMGYIAEFLLGHTIDSDNYNKLVNQTRWVHKQYEKVEPYYNILSSHPEDFPKDEIEKMVETRVKERLADIEERLQRYEEAFIILSDKETSGDIRPQRDKLPLTEKGKQKYERLKLEEIEQKDKKNTKN